MELQTACFHRPHRHGAPNCYVPVAGDIDRQQRHGGTASIWRVSQPLLVHVQHTKHKAMTHGKGCLDADQNQFLRLPCERLVVSEEYLQVAQQALGPLVQSQLTTMSRKVTSRAERAGDAKRDVDALGKTQVNKSGKSRTFSHQNMHRKIRICPPKRVSPVPPPAASQFGQTLSKRQSSVT